MGKVIPIRGGNGVSVPPGPPQNVDDLLFVCRLEISRGRLEEARKTATAFADRVRDSRRFHASERFRRLAYAWYILSLAAYNVCQSKPDGEVYPFLIVFFQTYKTATWYFLQYVQFFNHHDRMELPENRIRDDLDTMYNTIYRTWGTGRAGRADLAANQLVSV